MRGVRLSVRLPNRIVAICVRDPIGAPCPRLASSTPAINVDDTAPRPTVSTPSRPAAGWMVGGGGVVTRPGYPRPDNSGALSHRHYLWLIGDGMDEVADLQHPVAV